MYDLAANVSRLSSIKSALTLRTHSWSARTSTARPAQSKDHPSRYAAGCHPLPWEKHQWPLPFPPTYETTCLGWVKKKNSNLEIQNTWWSREGVKVQKGHPGPRHRAIELYATSQDMSGQYLLAWTCGCCDVRKVDDVGGQTYAPLCGLSILRVALTFSRNNYPRPFFSLIIVSFLNIITTSSWRKLEFVPKSK